MDENNLRFTTNQRLQMITLANFLNDEKKFGKATEVLDRSLKVMPRKNVPYEPLMAYMVDAYYNSKATAKANKLSKEIFDQCEEEYKFYTSADIQKNSGGSYKSEVDNLERALQMLENSASLNDQKDLSKAYTARMHAIGVSTVADQQMSQDQQQGAQRQMPDQAKLDSMIKAFQDSSKAGNKPGKKSGQ
jgi:hypothetical protein